jgi:hypothetical protein
MKALANFTGWIPKLHSIIFLLNFPLALIAQFTPGRLVVLQAGDSSIPLSSNGNSILFKEYSANGTPGFSMSVPSTGSNALIIRGSANSEGHISLSEDATCIVFGGYAQTLPFSSPLNSPAASTINRGIGSVFASGAYSMGAIGAGPFANGDIRGATATNSINLWASSSSAGTSYYGPANAQGNVQNSKSNLRAIHVFNHQLFISSHSAAGTPSVIGIYSVGTGTPVSSSQMVSLVFATGNNSQPCQFYFNAAHTICYVADSRNSGQGGIQKWIKPNNTWSLAYTLSTGTSAVGALGVVADFSGSFPKVFATTSEGSNNRLVAINDLGSASTATTLASASLNNTVFRGLCFSPGTIPCNSPVVLGISSNSVSCSNDTLVLFANVIGNAPLSYTWNGSGSFSSFSAVSPSIINSTGGNYTLSVSNACGTSSAVLNVSINPSPSLQVNAPNICSGGTATLIVSGAHTYTWSTGGHAFAITVSPISNSVYTVTGTSSSGCVSAPYLATVTVFASLALISTSSTICAGNSATLHVTGASSYTWSNAAIGPSIIVSPTVNSSYTVVGAAPGCLNASTTANVFVNALPDVTLTLPFTTVCETETLFEFNGTPSGGVLLGSGISGNLFSPAQAGIGTHTITYTYTDSNSCTSSNSQTLTVSNCTNIKTNAANFEWTIYPNPVKDELYVSCDFSAGEGLVFIFTPFGEKIKAVQMYAAGAISVQDLRAGLYVLEINSNTIHYRTKFIKE